MDMKITITQPAAAWYSNELELSEGDHLRFYVRLGGCSTVQSGFSLGVAKEAPKETGASVEQDGITFYVEREDLWYFDGHDLTIDFNKENEDVDFSYE